MRRLWNAVSFLAVVNLLALVMFAGWLWMSGRLDRGRLDAIREMLATTIGDAAEAQANVGSGTASVPPGPVELLPATLGRPAEQQVELIAMRRAQEALDRQGLIDDSARLAGQLDLRETQIERRREALEQERAAWEAAIAAREAQESDEQFARTVKLYESLPGKQGKKMLLDLAAAGQADQAVAYINAMNTRAASKILREFKTDEETKLATELLEMLRTYGVEAVASPEPSDDRAPADDA